MVRDYYKVPERFVWGTPNPRLLGVSATHREAFGTVIARVSACESLSLEKLPSHGDKNPSSKCRGES